MKAVRQRERSFTLAEMLVAVALSAGLYVMFTQVFIGAMKIINETGAYFNVYHQVAGAYTTMRENSEQHPIRWWDISPGWRKPPLEDQSLDEYGNLVKYTLPSSSFFPYFVWTNKKKNPNTNVMEASFDLQNDSVDLPIMLLHGLVKTYHGPGNKPTGNSNFLRVEGSSVPKDRLYDGPNDMPSTLRNKPAVGGLDQCYQLELFLVGEGKTPVPSTQSRWFIFRFWVF